MQEQFLTMLRMQNAHNEQVHPEWREQGYEYYRAVWVECAEMLDHYGWKWWKHQQAEIDQVKLELVDIWHFGLSELIRAEIVSMESVPPELLSLFHFSRKRSTVAVDSEALRLAIEELAKETLVRQSFHLEAFVAVMQALPMSFDELFQMYIGKNVLNNFRQAHGYKSGEYRKTWSGREDNEHLVDLCAEIDPASEGYPDLLYAALSRRYLEYT